MASPPSIPDELWSLVLSFLLPPPPLSTISTPTTLLSEILEAYRPPETSRTDLNNFWLVSKRFKNIAQRSYYSYITLNSHEACRILAMHLDELEISHQESPASLVLGLTVYFALDDPPSLLFGLHPLEALLGFLPSLAYLDLSSNAPSPQLLSSLLIYHPPLRSLVGLGLTQSNYNSIVNLLSSVSATLTHLTTIDLELTDDIFQRPPSSHRPQLTLPNLHSLRFENAVDVEYTVQHVSELEWTLPRLRYFVEGLFPDQYLGGAFQNGSVLKEIGMSLKEMVVNPMWLLEDWLEEELPSQAPGLDTLAMAVDPRTMKHAREQEGDRYCCAQMKQLILVQPPRGEEREWTEETLRGTGMMIERSVSKGLFPNRERVWWVCEEKGDALVEFWPPIAAELASRGVEVVQYL